MTRDDAFIAFRYPVMKGSLLKLLILIEEPHMRTYPIATPQATQDGTN